ncbi:MAG TPA: HAD-IA family hydrolase [Thermodesulfovibrionales bacterium]|nr:HAD-IA family hydrolase [Thermodesulfovibrionales bacterium]
MPIKLIAFDLDGTLIDSSVDITNALNYALEPYSRQRLSTGDTIKLIGEGINRLIEKLVGDRGGAVADAAMKRFLDHYTQHILDFTTVYFGVEETLERLDDYKKAVISNKREDLSRMVLDGLRLSRYFDIIIGSDTTPERKPSPVPILKALSEMNINASDAVIVGDSNYDVDAGKAAGVITIAVTYGYRPREVIAHADYIIDKMTDLVPVLARINS